MTKYTGRLKRAANVEGKQKIIKDISSDPLFKEIDKKFDKMRLAKQALIKRHQESKHKVNEREELLDQAHQNRE